jgi:hypothetical protein
MSGFLCVPRDVWAWKNVPRRDAYIDLQMRSSWGEQTFKTQGKSVTVQVGEVLFSAREASLWWNCTEKTVRVLMEWLEGEGLISYPEGKQHRRMFRVAISDYWGEPKGASRGARKGDSRGATKGASNPAFDNELPGLGAVEMAQAGAQGRAIAGAQHIGDELIDKDSLPTEERNTHTRTHTRDTRYTKRCPAEWEPKDDHRRIALSLGVDFLSELEIFRDYEYATAHKDWDATFRVWLRKAGKNQSRYNGNGNGKHPEAAAGEDSGELQRRRQAQMEQAEAEYQVQRNAWKQAIAARWEAETPDVKNRIRGRAEAEFEHLRSDEVRFKRAVDPRAVQLYADEINLPEPPKRSL